MAVTQAKDLIIARSDVAALHVAAAVWDAAVSMNVGNAAAEAQQRLLKRHAHELLELHGVDSGSILRNYVNRGETNGSGDYSTSMPEVGRPTYNES